MAKETGPLPDESVDGLCDQILGEARKECGEILRGARMEAARILDQNVAEVAELRRGFLGAVEGEASARKRRILATVNLGTRRVILEAREKVLGRIMDRVRELAAAFRSSPEYPSWLREMVIDGALALDSGEAVVVAALCDRDILGLPFLKDIARELKGRHSKEMALTPEFDIEAKDIGVVLRSRDRRMECDNTFRARLARVYDDVRADILSEVFGGNV